MNANTVTMYSGGTGRNQIPALVLSTTTETAFSVGTDTGSAVAVLSVPSLTAIVGASAPLDPNVNPALTLSSGRQYGPSSGEARPYYTNFDGSRPFKVRLSGTFTSGVASNDLQVGLYLGTSATLGSDSVITVALTTGTSANFGAVSGGFLLEVMFIWDSTSGKLSGILENAIIAPSGVASTVKTPAAVTATAAAAVSNLNFVASAKWNAANAGNTVQVSEFSLSQE